ncbi:PREDICTED: uncharacterized protein LOC103343089 [Prunus mume]|uniref:Uncharacterized protein LOC103343089 n=1 Tax=Prunus mume TaxID=102107 RepID=A0ABM0PV62_PRUMU|nr:PREDICTED: uncharacterized protein LOC103343089 [Prunus mume]
MAEPPPAKITHVTALLVVPRGQVISAARYYQDVFGAAFIDKYDDVVDIVHQATIKIGATTFYITDQYSRDLPAPNLCIRLKCQDPKSLNARISRDGFSYGQRPTAKDFYDDDGLLVRNVKDKFGHSWQLAKNKSEYVDPRFRDWTVRSYSIEPVRVTPNMLVPAPEGRHAFELYDKAFRGERRCYTTIPGPAQEQPVGCYLIDLGSSHILVTDDMEGGTHCRLQLELDKSCDITEATDFALDMGCKLVSGVKEDPLRPGVLMATVEDRYKFVWQLCQPLGGLGIWKEGFLSEERFKVSYIFEDLRTMHLSNKFRCRMPDVRMQVLNKTDYDKNSRKFDLGREDIIVVEFMSSKEVVDDLKKKIGFRGLIVGIVNEATDICPIVQRDMMEEYGCHVTLGLSLQTHDLTHEAVREIFIAALELREKRTVGQSTERVRAIEFVKGLRTTENQIEEVQEEEPEPQKEEPKRKRRRWNKLRNRPKRHKH